MTTEHTVSFADLALAEPLLRALKEKDYTHPSPIQAQSIPHLLQGRDLIGLAQTGTGKTAAFALPILHHLLQRPQAVVPRRPRVLVLAPTRELAAQIGQSFVSYGKHTKTSCAVVFGGVNISPQIRALARGVDVLVATPGRLMDLQRQKHVSLDKVEIFVLDEADRMLDLGFVHEIKRIITQLPPRRQSLLFSATMPTAIQSLAESLVHKPVQVAVTPVSSTAERIAQQVAHVDRDAKRNLLVHLLTTDHPHGLTLVFVRMKHMANRLAEQLLRANIPCEAIHGNKSQNARERALGNFRTGRSRVLVATDIAARGIDVKGISLVVNFDLPEEPEAYVHRIGRTARAGAEGRAVAFCDRSERNLLRGIERLTRQTIPVMALPPGLASSAPTPEERDSDASARSFPRRGRLGSGISSNRPNLIPRRAGAGAFRRGSAPAQTR